MRRRRVAVKFASYYTLVTFTTWDKAEEFTIDGLDVSTNDIQVRDLITITPDGDLVWVEGTDLYTSNPSMVVAFRVFLHLHIPKDLYGDRSAMYAIVTDGVRWSGYQMHSGLGCRLAKWDKIPPLSLVTGGRIKDSISFLMRHWFQ